MYVARTEEKKNANVIKFLTSLDKGKLKERKEKGIKTRDSNVKVKHSSYF